MKGRAIALLRPSPRIGHRPASAIAPPKSCCEWAVNGPSPRPNPAAAWCFMVVPHPPFPAKLDRPAAAHDCVVFSIAAHVPLAYAPIRPLLHAWKESMARYILLPTSDHCSLCSRRRRARSISCGQLEGETLTFRRVLSNARKRKTDLSTHRTLCDIVSATRARLFGAWGDVSVSGRQGALT
jgi:hypothetical protein